MAYMHLRTYPNLKTWRTAMGYSQTEAARLLGISQTYYNRLERQMQLATGPRAKYIRDKTGVAIEALLGIA